MTASNIPNRGKQRQIDRGENYLLHSQQSRQKFLREKEKGNGRQTPQQLAFQFGSVDSVEVVDLLLNSGSLGNCNPLRDSDLER